MKHFATARFERLRDKRIKELQEASAQSRLRLQIVHLKFGAFGVWLLGLQGRGLLLAGDPLLGTLS